ncbi:hypothetical protein TVAG_466750 [Trichomonas vaginalis G3]|uniref:Uncharacterized protein n=1 Tax=Trichomonas vaginalis (strain ATCC PRA-98 / G3) TaxID=412133 RepID=A2FLA1_TRIV3|nr:hypothetical protein TVAGG3_0384310 [Trichomonas vaginalis G3]EAX94317.1 hypothetical protein TVAG_466750 [Trichomonas vaginalis G3]KAI5533512.1 hypothetical protein TVAGG3_0384310 [Trichomonas vaginalis G3]|eukprot:XP_001307247.1 hypothetical protein [Trichomonas vaginalis G3]
MWYEDDNQFVRAPTPKTFDNLVQDLEGRDSVLFESIALPSSNRGRSSVQKSTDSFTPKKSNPIEVTSSIMAGLQNFSFADEDPSLDFTIQTNQRRQAMEEASNLQKKISELEFTLREKEAILEEKDEIIQDLKDHLKGKQVRPNTTNDANTMYKEKYNMVIKELTDLKRQLAMQGKVRRVKARALQPVHPDIKKRN